MIIDEIKSEFSGLEVIGSYKPEITGVCTIFDPSPNKLTWVNDDRSNFPELIGNCHNNLIVLNKKSFRESFKNSANSFLLSDDPKSTFCDIFDFLIARGDISRDSWFGASRTAYAQTARGYISGSATVMIDVEQLLASGCWIGPNAVIHECVSLGRGVRIGANSVIGGDGFGFFDSNTGENKRMPHVGNIVIGDNVEIGACSTVDRGTIGATIIEDNVAIDNLVHTAHNVHIKQGARVVSNTTLCGSCIIGSEAWIGPNSVIKQTVSVGSGCTIGMGSIVTKNVPPSQVWLGNPARPLGSRP